MCSDARKGSLPGCVGLQGVALRLLRLQDQGSHLRPNSAICARDSARMRLRA